MISFITDSIAVSKRKRKQALQRRAKTQLESRTAMLELLSAEIAGLKALEDRGTGIDAEIKTLTGKIFSINHDGKPESAAEKHEILVMEGRRASLRDCVKPTTKPFWDG